MWLEYIRCFRFLEYLARRRWFVSKSQVLADQFFQGEDLGDLNLDRLVALLSLHKHNLTLIALCYAIRRLF